MDTKEGCRGGGHVEGCSNIKFPNMCVSGTASVDIFTQLNFCAHTIQFYLFFYDYSFHSHQIFSASKALCKNMYCTKISKFTVSENIC